jgi:hypothetical protein
MRKCLLWALIFPMAIAVSAQDADEQEIIKILNNQTFYWNKGDLKHIAIPTKWGNFFSRSRK